MKRLFSILFVLLIVAGITGCKNTEDDVLHLGLNAIIVEIDHQQQLIYVSDTEHEDVFGGRAAIDCSKAIERDSIFYVDYDSDTTDNLRFIEFEDLMVGDMIILGIYESELNGTDAILVEDIQLSTQRLD
mgnify:FL=1